jgi:DNA repair protein RadC
MNSKIAYEKLKPKIKFEREEFWAIGLDLKKEIIFCELLFLGTLRKCKIYPREIFRLGLLHNADQMIIAHTHPVSSEIYPSKEDLQITKQLTDLGKILDLEITDHLILGPKKYFSFYDEGFLS